MTPLPVWNCEMDANEYFDKEVKLYEIYRDYIKSEDLLRNSRTATFLTIQGLLFAAMGVTFGAGIGRGEVVFNHAMFVDCFRVIISTAAIASCIHMWARDKVMRLTMDGIDEGISNIKRSRQGVSEASYWLKHLPKWHYASAKMKGGSILWILSFHYIFGVAWIFTLMTLILCMTHILHTPSLPSHCP
jgi:hypothetical protein